MPGENPPRSDRPELRSDSNAAAFEFDFGGRNFLGSSRLAALHCRLICPTGVFADHDLKPHIELSTSTCQRCTFFVLARTYPVNIQSCSLAM